MLEMFHFKYAFKYCFYYAQEQILFLNTSFLIPFYVEKVKTKQLQMDPY